MRYNKTINQQCKYYEVNDIYEYMIETYLNGNKASFRKLYKELCKESRKDFIDYIFSEVSPIYHREIIKTTI
jgi:hypothetical protein